MTKITLNTPHFASISAMTETLTISWVVFYIYTDVILIKKQSSFWKVLDLERSSRMRKAIKFT